MAIVEAKNLSGQVNVLRNNSVTIYRKIENMVFHEEREYYFVNEFDSDDEVQQEIDWYRTNNNRVCCLHENGKHQLYVRR